MTSNARADAPPPVSPRRVTRRVLVFTVAGIIAAGLVVLAGLNGTGIVTRVAGRTLPAYAFVDLLGAAFVTVAAPYGVLEWRETRRLRRIEARLPDFLGDLASLHKAGLTLMDAVQVAAEGEYGPLTEEVRHAAAQVKWGVPVLDALAMMRERLGTPVARRTLTVVLEAGRAGGRVHEVLNVAADIGRRLAVMRGDRRQEMSAYLVVVYVASFVFLFVALALNGVFLPRMMAAVGGADGAAAAAWGFAGMPEIGAFRGLYVTAAVVQGIGNGLVGGVLGDGRVRAGIKHAAVLTGAAVLAFTLFT